MFKHTLITSVLVLTVLLAGAGYTNAQTADTSAMKTQIEMLLKRIAELQAQLKTMQGEVNDLIKAGLSEGMTDGEIKEIQELLATDPTIYPGGLATGYFGPMTREAIKRFQEKFGLEVTGTLNEETRQALTEVRKERREKGMQTGLLRSEEVRERIKMRLKDKWENCDYIRPGKEAFCKDKKDKSDDDDDMSDDDDMDDDSDDDSDDRSVSRDDARRAVVDAQNELNQFRKDLEDLDGDELDDAEDMLRDAQADMSKARRALARQEFDDAFESAEEVLETLSGKDSDDDDDDMDDDSDDRDNDDDDSDDRDDDDDDDDKEDDD